MSRNSPGVVPQKGVPRERFCAPLGSFWASFRCPFGTPFGLHLRTRFRVRGAPVLRPQRVWGPLRHPGRVSFSRSLLGPRAIPQTIPRTKDFDYKKRYRTAARMLFLSIPRHARNSKNAIEPRRKCFFEPHQQPKSCYPFCPPKNLKMSRLLRERFLDVSHR